MPPPNEELAVAEAMPVARVRTTRGNPMDQLGHITKWLLAWSEDPRFSGEFWLCHLPEGERPDMLISKIVDLKIKPEKRREKTFEFAQEFYDYALQNIECHSLGQKYGVGAYEKGRGELKVLGRHDFRLEPPPGNMVGGLSQPASETGVLAQSMHFSEISFGLAVQSMRQENERLVKQIKERDLTIAQHQSQQIERFSLMETMMSQNLERELLRDQHKEAMERQNKMWATVELAATVVLKQKGIDLSAAMGGGAEAAAPVGERLMKFVQSLRADQVGVIAGCLDESQAGEFFALIQAFKGAPPKGKGK